MPAMHPRRSLRRSPWARLVLAATVGFGPTASATPNIDPLSVPDAVSPALPVDERLEQAGRHAAGPDRFGDADRSMGVTPQTLHPDFGSFAGYGIPVNLVSALDATLDGQLPVAGRVRPGRLPDPRLAHDRGRRGAGRPPHADGRHAAPAGCGSCSPRACRAATGRRAPARPGTSARTRSDPDGWTSADAAGLPIYPGLARYDEVAAGTIAHALRFTVPDDAVGPHLPGPP